MKFFELCYDMVLCWVRYCYVIKYLGGLSFLELVFFFILFDVMFVLMVLF